MKFTLTFCNGDYEPIKSKAYDLQTINNMIIALRLAGIKSYIIEVAE